MGKQREASPALPTEQDPSMKLTTKTITSAKPPPGKTDHIEWDDDLPGFGLRLRAGGADRINKTWIAQYRAHGRTRRMKIGTLERLAPDEARKAARKVLARVEIGGDPQAEKAAQRKQDGFTLAAVAKDYLAAKAKVVRPNTYRLLDHYLTGPHFKSLHNMPVDQVSRRDIAARLTKIIAENGSPTARRARAALSARYVWALGHGLCEANPVIGSIAPEDSKPRARVLTNSEIAATVRAGGRDANGRI